MKRDTATTNTVVATGRPLLHYFLLLLVFKACFDLGGQYKQEYGNDDDDDTDNDVVADFGMADRDSYGFFDNIHESDWLKLKHRVLTTKLFIYANADQRFPNGANFMMNNVDPIFSCMHLRRIQGFGDGPKYVCDPHRLLKYDDCLVYSFGSQGKYEFEDGLIHNLGNKHCEIHVFDPNPRYGRPNDPVQKNIHFHAIGLKSSYANVSTAEFGGFVFQSLPHILKQLGHEQRRIDILKIDCEGCEWSTYQDWIQPKYDVRQLLIETHAAKMRIPSVPLSKFYQDIFNAGFVPYSKEANTLAVVTPPGHCFEYSFIKLAPTFFEPNEFTQPGKLLP